ncbi:hypothetical protein ACHAWF_004343 [Thalassiosira exigua]
MVKRTHTHIICSSLVPCPCPSSSPPFNILDVALRIPPDSGPSAPRNAVPRRPRPSSHVVVFRETHPARSLVISSMKPPTLLLALLPCAAAVAARADVPPDAPSAVLRRPRAFSSRSCAVPRGGGSDDGGSPPPSSASSAPDLSSLLSGTNLPGMPDLSQAPSANQIQQSMEQLTSMLSSPQFKEMLDDPSKLEGALETMRQSLLSALEEMEKGDNPMMAMMMDQMKQQMASSFPGGWDGMKALVSDEEKWKEMMGGLVEMMKGLGEEDLGQLMNQMAAMGGMGGMPGMGGMGGMPGMGGMGGAPGGMGDALGGDTLAGLDDLSEGED